MRLQVRFILMVVTVCGAVWLSALVDMFHHRDTVLRLAERQHDSVARALAEQSARSFQSIDLILRQAALLDPAGPASKRDESRIPELLHLYVGGLPQVRDIILFDPERRLHMSSGAFAARWLDVSDRAYFIAQRGADQGLYVGEPIVSRSTGDPTFVLSRRLPGASFRGIVAAAVQIEYFRKLYADLQLGSQSSVDLLRADGHSLVSSVGPSMGSAAPPLAEAVRQMAASDAACAQIRFEDPYLGRSLSSLCRVPGYPVVVAVGRSESTILQGWESDAAANAARTFAITALAAVLLIAFLRQLRRHERLTAHVHQSRKLEALGTLAGGIAHDFNNIVGAILGYGELARQNAPAGGSQLRYLDNILLAANRARDLVARILAFSRPGIGALRPILLQQIVRDCVELVLPSLPLEVVVHSRLHEQPVAVMGEAAQLHQVIGNLLANAVQAVGERGRIDVSLQPTAIDAPRECAVGRLAPGRYAWLRIQDNGSGIAARDLEHIFDPFFTTKAPGVGTGLGLSLVHASVLEHKGAVAVQSELGSGTCFDLYFPLIDATPAPEALPHRAELGDGQVVLVVDDEPALTQLAEEVLASIGYEPVGCTGAQQALELFRAAPERFDALLTDVRMSGLSGLDLAMEVLRIRPQLPILLMSGFYAASPKEHPALLRARALLQKPLSAAQLAHAMAAVFKRHRPADQTETAGV